jgi:hypothetical protein
MPLIQEHPPLQIEKRNPDSRMELLMRALPLLPPETISLLPFAEEIFEEGAAIFRINQLSKVFKIVSLLTNIISTFSINFVKKTTYKIYLNVKFSNNSNYN